MDICLQNFRSFGERQKASLAPITFLVGENSTGKTSFLAGLRYLLDYVNRRVDPSFNREPFFLGKYYKDIAHYRGGRYGRAQSFSLSIADRITRTNVSRFRPKSEKPPKPFNFEMKVEFEERSGEAKPAKLVLDFDVFRVEIGEPLDKLKLPDVDVVSRLFKGTEEIYSLHDLSPRPFSNSIEYSSLQELSYRIYRTGAARENDLFSNINEPNDEALLIDAASKLELVTSHLRRQFINLYTLPPVRTSPERHYDPLRLSDQSEGDELIAYIGSTARGNPKEWQTLKSRLEEFGAVSGLFTNISVKKLGSSDTDPFRIQVKSSGRESNIIDVGYGVSQVLPLFVMLARLTQKSFVLLQQPEVHLHPSSQAAIGDVLSKQLSSARGTHLIVETHSDYIIDRVRQNVRNGALKPKDMKVIYFSKDRHNSKIQEVSVDANGDYIDPPSDYREFFVNESMRNMGF